MRKVEKSELPDLEKVWHCYRIFCQNATSDCDLLGFHGNAIYAPDFLGWLEEIKNHEE